jgi:hypothetical protein
MEANNIVPKPNPEKNVSRDAKNATVGIIQNIIFTL